MASPVWEVQFRRTLDDLADLPNAKSKLEEVLHSLKGNILIAYELEHEALQSGLLLDLIDINATPYKSAKEPSETTKRIFRAIEQIKYTWGNGFHSVLQQNGVFLPTRLARDGAEGLRNIAKDFTIMEFCAAIAAELNQPRNKGKNQEKAPSPGKRVVQTQDIRQAQSVLRKRKEESRSSTPDIFAQEGLVMKERPESPEPGEQDHEVEGPRGRSSIRTYAVDESSKVSRSSYGSSSPLTPSNGIEYSGADGTKTLIRQSGDHEDSSAISFDAYSAAIPDISTAAGSKEKRRTDSQIHSRLKIRRISSLAMEATDLQVMSPESLYDVRDKLSQEVGSPNPRAAPAIQSPSSEPLKRNDRIIHDLSPGNRLHGSTLDKLIKTFLPPSLAVVLELDDATKTRAGVSVSTIHGAATGTFLVGTLCLQEHWLAIVWNRHANTLSSIDSFPGYVKSSHWVDQFSLGLVDAGCPVPMKTLLPTPQQSNSWDCGIYLVVSLLRAVAAENATSSSSTADPEPIDGAFYRALFTSLFMACNDAGTPLYALFGPGDDPYDTEISIATSLKTSKKLRTCLELCEISQRSALKLFSGLGSALEKASGRIEKDVKSCDTLLSALAVSKHTIQQYCQRSVSNGNETHDNMVKIAAATKQKAERSASQTNDATESTQKAIRHLQSLGNDLSSRRSKLSDTIRAQKNEASKCRDKLRKELAELDEAISVDEQKDTSEP
ncbi:hypothetical protein HBH98_244250 [Parastagonospora nodorum]|nr:hypothetical protein HBH53_230290 [Parastagonospora nodorum]KAH3956360.1 hypothetical protein HBH51_243640 [Parastagonospora nodorum]KAH4215538.1 hypothetical protein HBI06_247690 [Parastagonospora nodorum]KAH4224209.1 hypothetical protein HBI05_241840 [Parastagonospora nodorum]KAH4334272.1 hypothetical protein HBH98_244250 [Parastagonospora nodorum]